MIMICYRKMELDMYNNDGSATGKVSVIVVLCSILMSVNKRAFLGF